jgi:uncharacterized protein YfkK (UPF0435 family)
MNDFDRDNFDWFINASAREQKEFMDNAEIEDLLYMIKLIRSEISDLHERELDVIAEDVVADGCEEANDVLRKFRLNK